MDKAEKMTEELSVIVNANQNNVQTRIMQLLYVKLPAVSLDINDRKEL